MSAPKPAPASTKRSLFALVGDLRYGRTAHSLASALSLYGASLHTVSPKGLELPASLLAELTGKGVRVTDHSSISDAIPEVDVIYVTRIQRERFPDSASYFDVTSSYRITPELPESAKKNLIILHPLPRVDEIDVAVDKTPHAYYFQQAENGVYARQALLALVLNETV